MNKSLVALEQIDKELYLILPKNIRDNLINHIKQDLERLEVLEKENTRLNIIIDDTKSDYLKTLREKAELTQENEKLKKALELACERLSWDCPVAQDLIDDLDCKKTCGDCNMKECWVKYFMKKVLCE